MHSTPKYLGFSAGILVAAAAMYGGCVGDAPGSATDGDGGSEASTSSDGGGGGDAACADTTSDSNNCGACGHACSSGDTCEQGVCGTTPVEIAAWGSHALESQSGGDAVCVLTANGDVYCWGSNTQGVLGIAPSTLANTATPTKIGGLPPASHISVGNDHACALLRDGTMWCWGNNSYGQLGKPPTSPGTSEFHTPAQVPGTTSGNVSIATRNGSTCLLAGPGVVSCWGLSDRGSLGHVPGTSGDLTAGSTYYSPSPIAVDAGTDITRFNSYEDGVCTLEPSGTVCFGNGVFNDVSGNPGPPVHITFDDGGPLTSMASLSGGRTTVCAAGSIPSLGYCWGQHLASQFGNDSIQSSVTNDQPPTAYPFGSWDAGTAFNDITSFAVGYVHVCALRADGSVWCAGRDVEGELGVAPSSVGNTCTVLAAYFPGTSCATQPVQTRGPGGTGMLSNAVAITAGHAITCAIVKEGSGGLDRSVYCWGANAEGELGHSAVDDAGDQTCDAATGCIYNSVPTKVDGLPH